ncbi:MAG: nicotinate phosphoribosyltransferase [Deltaproteobacteria bacterium]|nr:nicotinate phosphoribosyltransferase [Deltaproteobacteria bacterium]
MGVWDQYTPELLTDLYELTMAAAYLQEGMNEEATFDLYIRDYPPDRGYFVLAGIEHFLELLSQLRFSEGSLAYIQSIGQFTPSFIEYLRGLRFTGSVRAMREGRIFFPNEPVLEVTAPIIEAQVIETLALNVIQVETLMASKAARCVHAAQGRGLIDFSFRRTQGIDAGVKAARASYIVGFSGTSNLLAGKIYGIPVFGTMAHSYVTGFSHELDAFMAFARAFPENTVLLIDTYDTISGARKALEVARQMNLEGKRLRGVRLDSGDMVQLSREVRSIFRKAGMENVLILASGNLDEFRVEEMVHGGAEIDVFAVGTRMGVSADAPYFDIAYKMVEYRGRPVLKLSSGKRTWVGRKQVFRHRQDGMMREDVLALQSENLHAGEPLLETVIERGRLVRPIESISDIRQRFAHEWRSLPPEYRKLKAPSRYPVHISPALEELERRVSDEKSRQEIGR